jgi:hypothetical protein
MVNATPLPAIKLDWTLSPAAIEALSKEIIQRSKAVQDRVAALPPAQRSFESVIVPLAHSEGQYSAVLIAVF